MGVAASNRGDTIIRRDADVQVDAAARRMDHRVRSDESDRLRDQISELERDLARARRCIAELRRSKDARMSEARAEQSRSDCAIKILTSIAFPDRAKVVR